MLLVPKHVLEQELLFLDIRKNAVTSIHVVELAIIHYEGLAKNACDLYQEGLISPKKLQNLLSLINKEPKDFDIEVPNSLPN